MALLLQVWGNGVGNQMCCTQPPPPFKVGLKGDIPPAPTHKPFWHPNGL